MKFMKEGGERGRKDGTYECKEGRKGRKGRPAPARCDR